MPSGRRPLPSRVYWSRRLLLLGAAVALVLVGFVAVRPQLVSGSPLAGSPTGSATPSATQPATPSPTPKKKHRKTANAVKATPSPQGPCAVASLVVLPLPPDSTPAREQVTVGLSFTTTDSAACTFEVSSQSVVVRIMHGTTRIWSTQDCPVAITDQVVTVGPHTPAIVRLIWGGRTSSPNCPARASYAKPGTYLVQAAAYGSPAGQSKFQLSAAIPTASTTPSPTASPTASGKGSGG